MSIAKNRFLKFDVFFLTMIWKVQEVQVGSKNLSKIDQKMKSTWEGVLASMFQQFVLAFGAKLASKIEATSTPEGIDKTIKNMKRFLIDFCGF